VRGMVGQSVREEESVLILSKCTNARIMYAAVCMHAKYVTKHCTKAAANGNADYQPFGQ
jgi:hypothetical protein